MNKLEMAHDFAMKCVGNPNVSLITIEDIVEKAWQYADTMQAEADKRNNKECPKVLFEPKCEVDWRVAPCWAKEWVMRNGTAKWECGAHADSWEDAPSFGFTGTHIVERPHDL